MNRGGAARRSRLETAGWLMVLIGSGLLIFQGTTWFFSGPETALASIAERTTLTADEFRRGSPGVRASAFDVITIVTRQQAIYGAALGGVTLFLGWHGYRHRSRVSWWACWGVVAAAAGAGLTFSLAGGAEIGVFYVGFAVVFAVGLLIARGGLGVRKQEPERDEG